MSDVVVVGGGPAAHRLAARLVRYGHRGTVTVAGAEEVPPYNRALLGSVLDGTLPAERLRLPALPAAVTLLTGTRVTGVDRARRTVRTEDGRELAWDVLVLATGARPRVPYVPGLVTARGRPAEGVRTVRTAADCRALPPGPVTVLGGGVLGVESALALRRAGHEVALVHPAPLLMERHLDEEASAVLAGLLAVRGVAVHLGRRAAEYVQGKLVLDDGQVVAAGTVLLCAGTEPDTELARACGLTIRHGVVVDDRLRTSDPRIHAIGDCAEHAGAVGSTVTSAWEQAEALARVLTGSPRPYRPRPRVLRPRTGDIETVVLLPAREDGTADGTIGVSTGDTTGGATAGTAAGTASRTTDRTADETADETVSLTDRAGGRYARLALREGRIHRGVVIGPAAAVAAAGHLHETGAVLPEDRLALLTGSEGTYAGDGELPDDAVVCHCNNVTRGALRRAWTGGARDTAALARATRATTGCGSCAAVVRGLCTSLASSAPQPRTQHSTTGTATRTSPATATSPSTSASATATATAQGENR
ncbi:FAD-dependent oxidoreductase [Streptomyces sp. NPDC004065]|uniref:FAD-dependent oxidoreductase n=1 Tax=Streptomyces sp. NPDC004065 TaxID=3364689 RepID=UPI00384AEAF8